MKNNGNTLLVIAALLLAGIAALLVWQHAHPKPDDDTSIVPAAYDQSISDGTYTVAFSSKEFGLAVNETQMLVHPYILPCDPAFDYCLYYIGSAYDGTNFESAGLRMEKRTDLSAERLCLDTPPAGFDSSVAPSRSASGVAYAASTFDSAGTAAAGHSADGSLYRLFYRPTNTCYEFETRIGQSQYMNYPAGSIREFTASDQAAIKAELGRILAGITLPGGEKELWK